MLKMDETDLPLLSNIELVRSRHYLLQLMPDVPNQIIHGRVIIFFDVPSACELKGDYCKGKCCCNRINSISERQTSSFPIILECSSLTIKSVNEIKPKSEQSLRDYLYSDRVRNSDEDFISWNDNVKVPLSFTQDKWSVKIQNSEDFHSNEFPKTVCIDYSTCAEGESISWRKCDGGDVCFFTAGSFFNNRSLIPSQDRPFAMATWQAWIIVPESFYVGMTGDEEPVISKWNSDDVEMNSANNSICFYYYTSMVLPMATIAIAVGKWIKDMILSKEDTYIYNKNFNQGSISPTEHSSCNHIIYPCHMTQKANFIGPLLPVTLVTSDNHFSRSKLTLKFVKYILISSYKFLGIHPFKRLEIVILPRCFPHLGLASPNHKFLSKSVVMDDSSFYLRLSHEISHSWFGITIGPKNWEEEWLSEGVATYLEDSIFALALEESKCEGDKGVLKVPSVSDVMEKYSDFFRLRGHLRYKMLLNERENSEDELEVLCPDGLSPQFGDGTVTNGVNADKAFLQVHYLKGYFLLNHLSNLVSRHSFDSFLGMVAVMCHGQLISSLEFLRLFYCQFPQLDTGDNPEFQIFEKWLKNSDINLEIVDAFSSLKDNKLMNDISEHYRFWIMYDGSLKNGQIFPDVKIQMNLLQNKFEFNYSDQIVLLFELLLQVKNLKPHTLKSIHSFYNLENRSPEIQHRWCELIIKFKYPELDDISEFLVENQSMGVYLYGELMISGDRKHAKVAKDVFRFLTPELSSNSKAVISSMVFGK